MGMNIKNAKAEQLARDVSALTGETLTGAIATALQERLERLRADREMSDVDRRAEAIRSIARDVTPRLPEPWRSQDHGDLLYDEQGLPT